jgi:uncharacterized protein
MHNPESPDSPARCPLSPLARAAWTGLGLLLVGLGGIGMVLPVMPTTVFFIGAAGCFARSSPRLERWVLDLPYVGPMVSDYRNGLGMPRRAKVIAISAIMVSVSLSALLAIPNWPARTAALALGLVGAWYVAFRVPTREHVLANRHASAGQEAR